MNINIETITAVTGSLAVIVGGIWKSVKWLLDRRDRLHKEEFERANLEFKKELERKELEYKREVEKYKLSRLSDKVNINMLSNILKLKMYSELELIAKEILVYLMLIDF